MANGLGSLMSLMNGDYLQERNEIHLKDEAAQAWRKKFQPIPNLKPGDKVRWKAGCKNMRHGDYGDIFEVFSVIDPPWTPGAYGAETGSNHATNIYDFTMATWENGEHFELFAFDSRRFERVELQPTEADD